MRPAELLERYLPAEEARCQYFLYGPPAMMVAVEQAGRRRWPLLVVGSLPLSTGPSACAAGPPS
jgi:hypothetical protein